MKKNLYLIIIYSLILGLIIGIPFSFKEWNQSLISNNHVLIMYIVSKAIFGLLFVFVCLWILMTKHARGVIYQASIIFAFFQFVPFIIRIAVYLPSFRFGFSLIVLIISLIITVGYFGLLFISNKKQLASLNNYQGKEIEIKKETDK